jgi:hypothetical protein
MALTASVLAPATSTLLVLAQNGICTCAACIPCTCEDCTGVRDPADVAAEAAYWAAEAEAARPFGEFLFGEVTEDDLYDY